jgi:Mg2+ and Co2+ transporter CorA
MFDSSTSIDSGAPMDVVVQHLHEPLYFRYNLITGQTTYVLLNAKRDLRELLIALGNWFANGSYPKLHPLALQTVIMFNVLSTCNPEIETLTKHLVRMETQLRQGSIFEITKSQQFSRYIQLLHNMSRKLITLEHGNQRDASNIDNLLRDLNRLWRLVKRHPGATRIDIYSHERTRDSLFSLRDLCRDRARRILNLKQRTQGLITLLYNLITGHDSSTNLRIAAESAKIAHEAKRDSTSMKIIAAMAMLYLPPTFVCSLFGTNLVALNTSAPQPTFVVSRLWWLYIIFTVPLMITTVLGFVVWRRWREGGRAVAVQEFEV